MLPSELLRGEALKIARLRVGRHNENFGYGLPQKRFKMNAKSDDGLGFQLRLLLL